VFASILDRRSMPVSIRTAFSVAIAICVVPIGTARGERYWPHYRSWGWDDYRPPYRGWGDYEPYRQKHQRTNKGYELDQKRKPREIAKELLQIIVSIADQKISVYDDGELIARSSVSTGVQGHPTPVGVFSVIGKELWHRSNIYSAAPMPYMQRITWSGIALHAGVLPGHPASHGCIRLAKDFAIRLWHLTKRGTRVVIAANNVDPIQIASPQLFSKPKTASSLQESSADALASKDALSIPSTPTGGVTRQKKAIPISIFVSRKLSRLFVRQRFEPLFDVPIKIKNPDEPLGTHVFTVLGLQHEGEASFRWSVVTMSETSSGTSVSSNKKPDATVQGATDHLSAGASASLDRIEIPQDAAGRISELLTPGSSLIVSDYGLSRETGNDTDFIVVMP
jgi:L,D-transpeptidase catalytic domain